MNAIVTRCAALFVAASLLFAVSSAQAQKGMSGKEGARPEPIVTIDRLVAHASTVPAVKGQRVDLFVREKVRESTLRGAGGAGFNGRVVLMVHGGYSPGVLAFDVPYSDYSWAAFLARAGYDVFVMDMTGYGRSSRPMMDDPCNLVRSFQKMLIPKTLKDGCEPSYRYELVNSDSETDDINAVVDYIRKLRGVDKINVIGWSGGGIRLGTFVSRHQEKVERFVILASSNYSRKNPDDRPAELPKPGAPATIQSREVGIDQRWLGTSKCADSIEPGMPEYIWGLNAEHDPLGATWGSGGLRAPTRTYWGWNANAAKKITVPTLIMVGEQDDLMKSNLELIEDLGATNKVFLSIACATHFVVWEKQRRILYRASLDWLRGARLNGRATGSFRANEQGVIQAKQ